MKTLKLFVYVTCQINARLSRKAPLGRVQITGSSPTADIITIAATQVDKKKGCGRNCTN